ncbi:MAG TPA: GNAT family N-acetyltransferase [Pseudonocardiaceae bacterium]|nr:GNAT family N-acetyltransferase [Pseudonocardiaceae bacterium]
MRETRLTSDRGTDGWGALPSAGLIPASDVAGYACPDQLPATASAMSLQHFQRWMHFTLRRVTTDGATLRTVAGDVDLLPHVELTFTVTVPFTGTHEVHAAVRSIRHELDGAVVVRVSWIDPPCAFLTAVAEYLMIAGTGLTPAQLRASGLPLHTAERAVTFGSATIPRDEPEILDLRFRAHQHEGRLPGMTPADLASAIDVDARHLVCRYDGRIIGYVRAIFVDGDPARSQYLTLVGHQVPSWLWRTGFVEGGAAAVDPDFQRAGLFVPLVQHLVEVAVQSGFGYVLGACGDELLDMYRSMGFEMLETREVEPKPGWRFRSHLFHLDIDRLIRNRPRSKNTEAMAAAALFARSSDRDDSNLLITRRR